MIARGTNWESNRTPRSSQKRPKIEDLPGTLLEPQNGTKIDPKWSQNGSKMEPKWIPNGAQMNENRIQKNAKLNQNECHRRRRCRRRRRRRSRRCRCHRRRRRRRRRRRHESHGTPRETVGRDRKMREATKQPTETLDT